MKSLFGKILVGAASFAMAIGMSSYAAQLTIDKVEANKDTGAVVISGTIADATAASVDATILVLPDGVSPSESLEDAQIKYINQDTVDADGKFSFPFSLETGVKYAVYCGGTEVDAIDSDAIDLAKGDEPGPTPGTTYTIVGTVELLDGAEMDKVSVKANDKEGEVKDNGEFTIEVEAGTYTVVIGREGYLFRTIDDVVVNDTTVEDGKYPVGITHLLAGDVVTSDPANISLEDLQALLNVYNTTDGDGEFNSVADLNDDKMVSLADLQALLTNYNMVSDDYDAE